MIQNRWFARLKQVSDRYGQSPAFRLLHTSGLLNSGKMGAAGDPPLALRRVIDKGLRPNDAGHHVTYLEVYEPDVAADQMQLVLRYGASLFD